MSAVEISDDASSPDASSQWVDPAFQSADAPEHNLRPVDLDSFTGQEQARANLRVFVASARARGAALDHVLLHGPPGLGKTTLAQIIARECGLGFKATSGPILAKAGDLAAVLTQLQARDVLFIDEIHRLHPAVEEVLYPAMEDRKLDLMIGEGPSARTVQIDLPPFTLVGATTRIGMLSSPLRDRFGIPIRLEYYRLHELEAILTRAAGLMRLDLLPEAALVLAKRSRGTPRIAGRLLRRVADFAIVAGTHRIEPEAAEHALDRLDVDRVGLDAGDRRYLHMLIEVFNGGPTGLDTLAAALSEARDTLEDVIEPYLLQLGFIQRTPRGRIASPSALQHLRAL